MTNIDPAGPPSPATRNIINNTTIPINPSIANIAKKIATLSSQLIKNTRNKITKNTPNPKNDIPILFSPIGSVHIKEIINGIKTKYTVILSHDLILIIDKTIRPTMYKNDRRI